MNGPMKQYTNEMFRRFGYYATWEPNVPLKLGDIGVVKKNVFTKLSNIENEKIGFDEIPDTTPGDLEYLSQGSVTVTTKLSGTIPSHGSVLANADAGIIVEFEDENSILFKANGTRTPSIKDKIALGERIIERYKASEWDKNWVVITELFTAETATVLISNKSQGRIELKANADIQAANLDIADAKFNFSTVFSKGIGTKFVANKGITPLFRIMGIKTRWFRPPNVVFTARRLNPLDLLTPKKATGEMGKHLYFGNVDFDFDIE